MRTVWGVLAVLSVATLAAVAIGVGVPSSANKLPGPVTVRAAASGSRPSSATPTRASSRASLEAENQPVRVVTPNRPVSSLPAPIGSDSWEAEQTKSRARFPTTIPSTSTVPDR